MRMKVRLKAVYEAYPFDGTWGAAREICGLAPTLLSFSVKDEELQMGTILIMRRDGGVDEVLPGDYVLQMDAQTFGMVKGENFDKAYETIEAGGPTEGVVPCEGKSKPRSRRSK
jgi:hypothetical protein